MRFPKNSFFCTYIIHHINFSDSAWLIAEVVRSQFLLIAFISQHAFSHLFVSHLFLLIWNQLDFVGLYCNWFGEVKVKTILFSVCSSPWRCKLDSLPAMVMVQSMNSAIFHSWSFSMVINAWLHCFISPDIRNISNLPAIISREVVKKYIQAWKKSLKIVNHCWFEQNTIACCSLKFLCSQYRN